MKVLLREIDINAGGRRAEREKVAVDALVAEAFGSAAVKSNLPSGLPLISIGGQNISEPFSISHCEGMAALAVGDGTMPVGMDIEKYRIQLRRVIPKFLTPEEAAFYSSDEALLKAWTLKEATYKAARTPGLALTDIRLPLDGESSVITANARSFRIVESRYINNEVMLSVIVAL